MRGRPGAIWRRCHKSTLESQFAALKPNPVAFSRLLVLVNAGDHKLIRRLASVTLVTVCTTKMPIRHAVCNMAALAATQSDCLRVLRPFVAGIERASDTHSRIRRKRLHNLTTQIIKEVSLADRN